MKLKELVRRALFAALVGLAVLAVTAHSSDAAAEFKAGAITVEQPWSRATPGGVDVGAGYLTITNSSDSADRLVSVTTEVSGRAEIHEMSMAGGMMKMREVTDGVAIPAHGHVTLEPSSMHLMFLDLNKPLKEGETFGGTLTFEKAGSMKVIFEVKGIGATAPDDGANHHQ